MEIEGGQDHHEEQEFKAPEEKKLRGLNRRDFLKMGLGILGGYAVGTITGKLAREKQEHSSRDQIFSQVMGSENLDKESQKKLQENLQYLSETLPNTVFEELLEADKNYNKELPNRPPEIEGFEAIGVTNKQSLIDYFSFEGFHPKGTINGNLSGIYFHPFEKKGAVESPVMGGTVLGEAYNKEIHFYLGKGVKSPKEIFSDGVMNSFIYIYAHEWGHENDPFRRSGLSLKQRIDFLTEVGKVFDKKGTAYSDERGDMRNYVGKIEYADKKMEKLDKILEYWAVLADQFAFHHGQLSLEQNKEEMEVTKKWLTIKDPSFNVEESLKKAVELGTPAMHKIYDQVDNFLKK